MFVVSIHLQIWHLDRGGSMKVNLIMFMDKRTNTKLLKELIPFDSTDTDKAYLLTKTKFENGFLEETFLYGFVEDIYYDFAAQGREGKRKR